VLALALGIGATTAIFSFVSVIVLRPLPFPELGRIVQVWETLPRAGSSRYLASPGNFADWSEHDRVFSEAAAYRRWNANLTGRGEPERVRGFQVMPSFFPLLGLTPLHGRVFSSQESQPGREQVAILSFGFWQRSLAANPGAVGQTLELNGRKFTVVGIMPVEFDFPLGTDLWVPLALSPQQWQNRSSHSLRVLARLGPSVSLTEAQAALDTLAGRQAQLYPRTNQGRGVRLVSLLKEVNFGSRRFLLYLLGAAGFLLLLACANVANLQLARATARQKEIAVRVALGASRTRVVRLLLTESLLLSLLGAALGVLLALWGIDLMKASVPLWVARYIVAGLKDVQVDGWVLGFSLLAALASAGLSGLAPALQTSKPNLTETLKDGGRGSGTDLRGGRTRALLVVSEVSLAVILLVGAGLMVRGFRGLLDVDRGFRPANLLTMRTALPETKYPEPHQRAAFYGRVLERLEALPEVEVAAAVNSLPSVGGRSTAGFHIEGMPADPEAPARADIQVITEDYFQTLAILLSQGRHFDATDDQGAPSVAIISRTMARRFWPGKDPVGQRIKLGLRDGDASWRTIVGVVGDVHRNWLLTESEPTVYLPLAQAPRLSMTLAIRTASDPTSVAAAARTQVRNLDPDQPVYDVKTMEQIIAEFTSGIRVAAALMGIFAAIAFFLCGAGIYAVVAYNVSQRTHEIGVRMALGARRAHILSLFVGQGFKLTVIGVAIGLPLAFALNRLLSSFLLEVVSIHVATFGAFTVVILGVALLASYLPARRAAQLDPMVALRYE
jgi:putative ABC transport system permease protein